MKANKNKSGYYTLWLIVLCGLLAAALTVWGQPADGSAVDQPAGVSEVVSDSTAVVKAEDDRSPWFWEVNYFGRSLFLVNILLLIILTSIAVMLVLLVLILFNRRRIEREAVLHQYLLEKYQGMILDYLFATGHLDDFSRIASDSYRRQVLIDQIIDVSANLKGEAYGKLRQLYLDLKLNRHSVNKARSRRWHVRIKGFKELAFMNIKDANDEMLKSLQSKNDILRMEAQIALVRLSDDHPFEWLNYQVKPFSMWEQISLHQLLIQHDISVPRFVQWIDSPNHTVVMFALRMIREFRQVFEEDHILDALHHAHDGVRQLAIEVCGDLKIHASLKMLKSRYRFETYENKLEIVKTMGKIPDEAMIGFLKLVLDKEDDVQLQIASTKAIENMGRIGVDALQKLMESEYKNYKIIIRHVLDKRIN